MKKNTRTKHTPSRTAQPKAPTVKPKRPIGMCTPRIARWFTYLGGFVALFVVLAWGYGDVLTRIEQDSYVSTSPDTMYYLLSRPMGHVYWVFRWILLLFKWAVPGALLLSAVYTLSARLADYALRLPRKWEGVGFVLALGQMGWMWLRGTNIYYKNEPSKFLVIAFAVLAVTTVLALAAWLIARRTKRDVPERVRPLGGLIAIVVIAVASVVGLKSIENVRLTARMQNMSLAGDWEGMIETAKSASRPTRAVAAYYACALEETDRLLDNLFDIPYEFPKVHLDSIDGSEEYGIFLQDANFHAGLTNVAYRNAMDRTVMDGPRLWNFKRLAVCALVNGEKALARKYLDIVAQNPFESAFVEKYRAMADNEKLIKEDAELAHVLTLAPKETNFEQNYPQPAFLGYNTTLLQGTDATLYTSIAACLYSKDLQSFLPRVQILVQKGLPLPMAAQQALAIMAIKRTGMLQAYPGVGQFVPNEVNSFLLDAKPYSKDRLALRHELKDRWLGTYMYYYYTENNDPDQVTKDTHTPQGAVN